MASETSRDNVQKRQTTEFYQGVILLYSTIAEIVEINGSNQGINKLSRMENVPG